MKIAICDDTRDDIKALECLISEYSRANSILIDIETFDDPVILLNRITYFDSKEYDIFFLDICMQENGIEVATKIRNINQSCPIVFATSSKDYAIDAFKVRALDYILKPLNKAEVFDCLSRILEQFNNLNKAVCRIKTVDHTLITLDIKSIAYIESNDRRMIIHMIDGNDHTSTSLRSKFQDSIPFEYEKYNFISCHSSYVVNMNHIKAISDVSFIIKNGDIVPISKRLLTKVKEKYVKYLIGE